MAVLDPEFAEIVNIVERLLRQKTKERLQPRLETLGRRGLLTSSGRGVLEADVALEETIPIAELTAQFLGQQRGEAREERLTKEQWDEIMKRIVTQQQFQMGESEKTRTARESEFRRTRQFQLEDIKSARERASKGAWAKFLTNLGLGAITGGIAPGLLGVGAGAKFLGLGGGVGRALRGGVTGAAFGGQTVGQIAGMKFLPPWLEDLLKSTK